MKVGTVQCIDSADNVQRCHIENTKCDVVKQKLGVDALNFVAIGRGAHYNYSIDTNYLLLDTQNKCEVLINIAFRSYISADYVVLGDPLFNQY
jgi:hypothetical protein